MTDSDRHARIKAAFLQIVAKPEKERAAALEKACGGDVDMRREIETLLIFSGDAAQTISISGEKPPRFKTGDEFASRYHIVALLGRGAIGEVYRAEDTTLGVEVALKVLINPSPALAARLLEEVRLARQITNPAICRVYDVGELDGEYFFTMEYIDGEDLQSLLDRIGRLPADKIRDVGIQICDGMTAAHALGVLHRDLKPSNVMLDAVGTVRITDFGVAVSAADSERDLVSGTPAYMAPEQLIHSQAATTATDLYAVGLILYEAATGQSLTGADTNDTTALRKNESFRKPSELVPFIPAELETLILQLLRADPAARPGSAAEVADRLRTIAPTGGAVWSFRRRALLAAFAAAVVGALVFAAFKGGETVGTKSAERDSQAMFDERIPHRRNREGTGIAVLPIENSEDDTVHEDLTEAVQDDLNDLLSRVDGLRVIGEASVERSQKHGGSPTDVGERVGADYVAYGRIDKLNGQLHLIVSLIDTETGKAVWEDEYDSTTEGLHDVEHDICDGIVKTVRKDEEFAMPRGRPLSANPDAAELYRRGYRHVPPNDLEQFNEGVKWLDKALAADPEMARAYTAKGTSYVIAAMRGWVPPTEGYERARSDALRALDINPKAADAHVVLANVKGDYDWDWAGAEDSYRKALRLKPSSDWAHRSYARFLSSQARFEEAAQESKRAIEISPIDPYMLQGQARRAYEAGDLQWGRALAQQAIKFDETFSPSFITLCFIYIELEQYDRAVESCQQFASLNDNRSDALAMLAYAYSKDAGREFATTETINRLEERGGLRGVERTALALAENDTNAAIDALSQAVDERARPSIWLTVHPLFESFRSHPRFQDLVRRVGLPQRNSHRDETTSNAD